MFKKYEKISFSQVDVGSFVDFLKFLFHFIYDFKKIS
jgi:hypothetical protein